MDFNAVENLNDKYVLDLFDEVLEDGNNENISEWCECCTSCHTIKCCAGENPFYGVPTRGQYGCFIWCRQQGFVFGW